MGEAKACGGGGRYGIHRKGSRWEKQKRVEVAEGMESIGRGAGVPRSRTK